MYTPGISPSYPRQPRLQKGPGSGDFGCNRLLQTRTLAFTVRLSPETRGCILCLPDHLYKGEWGVPYCTIDNLSMLKGSPGAFNSQATAFETAGIIYAPYYRQSALSKDGGLKEADMWKTADSIPYDDVSAAFEYFINNYNHGRPYILVGFPGFGGYHMWDYPFYYYNLRENAVRRVNKYFGK